MWDETSRKGSMTLSCLPEHSKSDSYVPGIVLSLCGRALLWSADRIHDGVRSGLDPSLVYGKTDGMRRLPGPLHGLFGSFWVPGRWCWLISSSHLTVPSPGLTRNSNDRTDEPYLSPGVARSSLAFQKAGFF